MLSSSDDEGDSYSSDGEEGSLVIDSNAQNEINQNGHQVDPLSFANSPDTAPERPWTIDTDPDWNSFIESFVSENHIDEATKNIHHVCVKIGRDKTKIRLN